LSTLTKALIVLLTISSIFLCGIVVTYVATADNYRQQYDKLKSERDALRKKSADLTEQVNEKIAEKDALEKKLRGELAKLRTDKSKLGNDLKAAEREKGLLLEKVNSWASIVKDFTTTNDKQGLLLKNTLDELKRIQAEQIKYRKELSETTTTLIEKLAIIDTLETDKRRLLEEKTDLQGRLGMVGRPVSPVPVTPEKGKAAAVITKPRESVLRGLVTSVDLNNSMASISLGKSDGARENMKFHVTRGDEFICDIVVVEVDTAESVGVLELVQQSPRVGDSASTGF
jgi:cell division protein FtsB